VEVVAGEGPFERVSDLPLVLGERRQSVGERLEGGEVVRRQRLGCTIEKYSSIWFSQEAWTGRWISWHADGGSPPSAARMRDRSGLSRCPRSRTPDLPSGRARCS
jgi:hypothetical protein